MIHYYTRDFAKAPGLPSNLAPKDLTEYRAAVLHWALSASRGIFPTNLATEVSQDIRLKSGLADAGRSIWIDERALSAGVFTAGGSTVATGYQPIQDELRGALVVGRAGAKILTGLQGNYSAGLITSDPTWTWNTETEQVSATDITTGRANGTPNRASTTLEFTIEVPALRPDAPDPFAMTIRNSAAFARDRAALQGLGVNGEPLGILNTTGAEDIDFGGVTATLAKAASFERKIVDNGGDAESIVFIAAPDVREKWKQIQKWTNASVALWADNDTILGRPALTTSAMPSGRIVAGDWKHMTLAHWGGAGAIVQLIVNPYTKAAEGKVGIHANMLADVITERPQCFAVSSNSAIL